jgi:hypothetical protein
MHGTESLRIDQLRAGAPARAVAAALPFKHFLHKKYSFINSPCNSYKAKASHSAEHPAIFGHMFCVIDKQ